MVDGDIMKDYLIRSATVQDAQQLRKIYGWYVQNTAITFEYEIPGLEEFAQRIARTLHNYPYLVAQYNGEVVGYAYAAPYITRRACDWSCEVSIYLDKKAVGQGLGRLLYTELEERLQAMGIVNMYASIACVDGDDPYVTNNSLDFHAHMGFQPVGTFRNCGYKFGRWYHLAWVEKTIGIHDEYMKEVLFSCE